MLNRPILGVLTVVLAAPLALAQSFTPIPDLAGGSFSSQGRAVSPDGAVVVGNSSSTNGTEALRWVLAAPGAGGLSDLAGGNFSSTAFACTPGGTVVFGQGAGATTLEAFRWTAAGGMVSLGFPATGGQQAEALGCSSDGNTACGDYFFQQPGVPPPPPPQRAFRWTASGGMEWLGLLPGGSEGCVARAISADGSIIVGSASDSSGAQKPFRWTAPTGMQEFAGVFGNARGISSNGEWIVGADSTIGEAFRWSQATGLLHLGIPNGRPSSACTDVSNDGQRVVGASGGIAILWEPNIGWRNVADVLLDRGVSTAGWTLTVCWSISDDGTVLTGTGTNPSGQAQGWVAIIPAPPPRCPGGCCCASDFNCDGDIGTDADIESFFACLAGNCPVAPCWNQTADVNGDGDIGTDADIEAFFRELAGSCC